GPEGPPSDAALLVGLLLVAAAPVALVRALRALLGARIGDAGGARPLFRRVVDEGLRHVVREAPGARPRHVIRKLRSRRLKARASARNWAHGGDTIACDVGSRRSHVASAGIVVALLDGAARDFELARSAARALSAERLAAWAAEQASATHELSRGER